MSQHPGAHLGDEVAKIIETTERGDDDIVVDLCILMHEDVSEADGQSNPIRQSWVDDAVLAQEADRSGVRVGGLPRLRRCDVMCDIDATFDGCNEQVLDAIQPQ